jgi:uncharacterized membrane protein (UPF0182 family)
MPSISRCCNVFNNKKSKIFAILSILCLLASYVFATNFFDASNQFKHPFTLKGCNTYVDIYLREPLSVILCLISLVLFGTAIYYACKTDANDRAMLEVTPLLTKEGLIQRSVNDNAAPDDQLTVSKSVVSIMKKKEKLKTINEEGSESNSLFK